VRGDRVVLAELAVRVVPVELAEPVVQGDRVVGRAPCPQIVQVVAIRSAAVTFLRAAAAELLVAEAAVTQLGPAAIEVLTAWEAEEAAADVVVVVVVVAADVVEVVVVVAGAGGHEFVDV